MTTLLIGTDSGLADGELAGHRVVQVSGDGWALTDLSTLWHLVDGRWYEAATAAETGLELTSMGHTSTGVLVGTCEPHLLRHDGGGLERLTSFDEAEDRDRWYTPWGGPAAVRSIATAPDLSIFVNVHVGGLVRSADAGQSWRQTIDIDVDVHQVVVHADGTVLAACGEGGLAVSSDGGETWRFDTDGLHATYCRAVAVSGDTVLLSASAGPFAKEGAVYRRPLGSDGPFERCTDMVPGNIDTFALAGDIHGNAAFGTETGEVWQSGDEGRTWDRSHRGLASVQTLAYGSD